MSPIVLVAALAVDAVFGEPRWLWSRVTHPAVVMGRIIGVCDRVLNNNTKTAGVIVVIGLVFGFWALGWILSQAGPMIECIITAILLAQKSLVQHVGRVADALRLSLISGKNAVAMIVSRNTETMTKDDVSRAAIESAAENLSDGVIAPAFWALIGGLPGILVYKAVNTADSMIGYRTDRHENFGWAAARLDDLMNWVPARLTACLLWLSGGCYGAWREILPEARRHKSPNAGWPEAVLARTLQISLAGPRSYDGRVHNLPWVNPLGRKAVAPRDIEKAVTQLWRAWSLFVIVLGILAIGTV